LENSIESFLTHWQDDQVSNDDGDKVDNVPSISEVWNWKDHLINSPWGEDTEADQQSGGDSTEHEGESNTVEHLAAEIVSFLTYKPRPLEIGDELVIKPASQGVAKGNYNSDSSESVMSPSQSEVHNSNWK
jgi:hypothetical protein